MCAIEEKRNLAPGTEVFTNVTEMKEAIVWATCADLRFGLDLREPSSISYLDWRCV